MKERGRLRKAAPFFHIKPTHGAYRENANQIFFKVEPAMKANEG